MNVTLHPYVLPLLAPVRTSVGTISERRGLLVRAESDGVAGWGDAAPLPGWPGGSLPEVADALAAWRDSTAGAPRDLSGLRSLSIARSAIDAALTDQRSRVAGVPMAQHLSPAAVGTVPVNVLVDLTDEAQVERDAIDALAQGFGTFKAKVGARALAEEVRLVRRLRSTVGPQVAIRLDANQAWELGEAETAMQQFAPIGIEFIEEPTANIDSWPGLAAAADIAIAADESIGEHDVSELAARCQVIVLKVPLVGGPSVTLGRALQLRQDGTAVVITSFLDNAVGVATALHMAAALGPVGMAHGLATSGRLARDVVSGFDGFAMSAGRITLPDGPGIGVVPDPDVFEV